MRTITNNRERHFVYGYDVPESVHADYDHLGEDERMDGWIHYRGSWYHVSDFMRTDMDGWDGFHGDSFFSGVAIRVARDGESYRIATLVW